MWYMFLFIVATGSDCRMGGSIYAVMLHIPQHIRNIYFIIIDAVRISAFDWVCKEATCIPKSRGELLHGSDSSDSHTLA